MLNYIIKWAIISRRWLVVLSKIAIACLAIPSDSFANAQAIIQMHRGKLTVKSELAQGSTFTIQLPDWSLD